MTAVLYDKIPTKPNNPKP